VQTWEPVEGTVEAAVAPPAVRAAEAEAKGTRGAARSGRLRHRCALMEASSPVNAIHVVYAAFGTAAGAAVAPTPPRRRPLCQPHHQKCYRRRCIRGRHPPAAAQMRREPLALALRPTTSVSATRSARVASSTGAGVATAASHSLRQRDSRLGQARRTTRQVVAEAVGKSEGALRTKAASSGGIKPNLNQARPQISPMQRMRMWRPMRMLENPPTGNSQEPVLNGTEETDEADEAMGCESDDVERQRPRTWGDA